MSIGTGTLINSKFTETPNGTLTSQICNNSSNFNKYYVKEGGSFAWDGSTLINPDDNGGADNINKWYHFAIVGDKSVGNLTYYLNGALIHVSYGNGNAQKINNYPQNDAICNIRLFNLGPSVDLNDIRVYDFQLQQSDITTIYNAGH